MYIINLTTNKTSSLYLENLCTLLNFISALIFIRQRTSSHQNLNKSATIFFIAEALLLFTDYLSSSEIRVIKSSLHFKLTFRYE